MYYDSILGNEAWSLYLLHAYFCTRYPGWWGTVLDWQTGAHQQNGNPWWGKIQFLPESFNIKWSLLFQSIKNAIICTFYTLSSLVLSSGRCSESPIAICGFPVLWVPECVVLLTSRWSQFSIFLDLTHSSCYFYFILFHKTMISLSNYYNTGALKSSLFTQSPTPLTCLSLVTSALLPGNYFGWADSLSM